MINDSVLLDKNLDLRKQNSRWGNKRKTICGIWTIDVQLLKWNQTCYFLENMLMSLELTWINVILSTSNKIQKLRVRLYSGLHMYVVRYHSVIAGKIRLIKPSAILKDKGILKIAVIKFNRISNYPTMLSFMYNLDFPIVCLLCTVLCTVHALGWVPVSLLMIK